MPKERQIVVRMDEAVQARLRRRAAELHLTLTEYVRVMMCWEFPYLLILGDIPKILASGQDIDDPERYVPVLGSVLARIERGERDLCPLIERLNQDLPASQHASKHELEAVKTAVRERLQQFRAVVEGFREFRKFLGEEDT